MVVIIFKCLMYFMLFDFSVCAILYSYLQKFKLWSYIVVGLFPFIFDFNSSKLMQNIVSFILRSTE